MGTIADKLTYLNGTKQAIKQAINEDFEVIDNNTTFREYADEISSNNAKYKDLIPKETKNATNTLNISNSAGLDNALVTQYGNTYQKTTTGKNKFNLTAQDFLNGATVGIGKRTILTGLKPNTTYTCSTNDQAELTIDTINLMFGGTSVANNGVNNVTPRTATSNANGQIYVLLRTTSINTFFENYWVQVEEGSTTTSYEPYTNGASPNPDYPQEIVNISGSTTINITDNNNHSKNYNISLPSGIELCKIEDYKDRIYPLNGKWYLEKKIGKVVLDGTENWSNFYGTNLFNISGYFDDKPFIIGYGLSNYYKYNSIQSGVNNGTINGEFVLQKSNSSYNIFIKNTDYSTPANFKTWLGTHNTSIYYPLETPITTEITESNYPTLYEQLNNIKLYKGVNHLTFTNESDLDVEFDIEYYKNWKLD